METHTNTDPEHRPSMRVVDAVATRAGVDPASLSPPLYDAIDPDALDALVESDPKGRQSPPTVRFHYAGYAVTVDGDGTVDVSSTDTSELSGTAPHRGIGRRDGSADAME